MLVRARGLTITLAVVSGTFAVVFLLSAAVPTGPAAGRAVSGVLAAVLVAACLRVSRVGLQLEPQRMVVREMSATYRLARAEVAGLAVEHRWHGRIQRLAVVCVDGRVVPAAWTSARRGDRAWHEQAAQLASGFGPTQPRVAPILTGAGRLAAAVASPREALTTQLALPVASADPGLTPQTVSPVEPAVPWLGWETVFIVTAFALPGVIDAVVILARHLGGVSDLNEFALPLPHNDAVSLLLLVLRYVTTALIVPIALLLLARTGQPPRALGLDRRVWPRDVLGGIGLLLGVWVLDAAVLLPLSHVLDNKHLTNTATNSHVPAYFVLYALVVSATTAVNEEVLVNGYFLTRLSQLGWSPWPALAISLAVRTSYHVYYGIGLFATIPFGYLATRSFQKRGRLGRPIVAHFLNDAVLLTIAVLTS